MTPQNNKEGAKQKGKSVFSKQHSPILVSSSDEEGSVLSSLLVCLDALKRRAADSFPLIALVSLRA